MTAKFRFETRYGSHCTFRTQGDRAYIATGYIQPDPALPLDDRSSGLTPKQALKLAAALTEWAERQQQVLSIRAERRKAG